MYTNLGNLFKGGAKGKGQNDQRFGKGFGGKAYGVWEQELPPSAWAMSLEKRNHDLGAPPGLKLRNRWEALGNENEEVDTCEENSESQRSKDLKSMET